LAKARHGHAEPPTPTYKAWENMKQRCLNPKAPVWAHYGGRGISICPEWLTFDQFLTDMGERPEGASLERVNNDGNYEPANCRWELSWREQMRNKRIHRDPLSGRFCPMLNSPL